MDLFFDESGNTGYNLLDPQQPFFVVASSSIGSATAEEVLKTAFPRYQGAEFKFSQIINSTNQEGLTVLGELLTTHLNDIFLFNVDKRFAVFAKMVDFLMEPTISAGGYDFYADGFCRKYANHIHFGLTIVSKAGVYDELLAAYMTFSRTPSIEALDTLRAQLGEIALKLEDEVRPFVEQMVEGAEVLTDYFDLATYRKTNDIQLTTMLAIISHWRQRVVDDFQVYHDASSNFLRHRETWDVITDQRVPRQLHQLGDGSTVEYPLRVLSTTSVDSADSYAVQLCDILAGFATAYSRLQNSGVTDHPLVRIAHETSLGQINYKGMAPGIEFPEYPPKLATGPDAVDLMTKIILSGMS